MEKKNINWGKIKTVALVVSLFGNLLFGSAAYTYYGKLSGYDELVEENVMLAERSDSFEADYEQAKEEYDSLSAEHEKCNQTIDDLTKQVQTLTTEKQNLQAQVTQLTDSNKSLQSQVDSLKASSSSSGSSSSSSSSSGSSSSSSYTPQSRTVYITENGSKYHKSGCRYLKKSKIAISLSEAKARGYTACSVCGG